jgi:hypothetical protein
MNGNRTLALVVVLALAAVPGLAAAEMQISVSEVEVSPSSPVTGDEVIFRVTVENLETNDAGYRIDRVVLEETDRNPQEYTDTDDLGTLPVGQSKRVPLSTTFENEGIKDLRVRVYGRSVTTGQRTVAQQPVAVRVRDNEPLVDIDANDTAVGVDNAGSVTVANTLGSPIEDVELRIDGADVAVTNRREVLTGIESDGSQTVDFRYRPQSTGRHTLRATLTYTTAGGTTDSVTEQVTIHAERVRPQLDVAVNDSVVDVESSGSVTVANGIGTGVRNVELTVAGEGVTVSDDRSVFTQVADGEAVETTFDFEAESAGEHTLNATLTYTSGGVVRTVSEAVTVDADPLRDRVSLEATTERSGDSQVVVVDVFNQGNAPATNVTVTGSSADASLQRVLIGRVPPGETRTVRLNTTLSADRAELSVRATYDLADERGETSASTAITQTPGTIGLTGVQAVPEGGSLRISGSASNLGTTDAQSVLVSVVETDRVRPVEPNPEFFVGPVPASDFASFDVYAATQGNVTEVALEVRYIVDGDQRSRTVTIDTASATQALAAQQGPSSRDDDGSLPVVSIAVGLVVALVVVAVIVQAWRASRDAD